MSDDSFAASIKVTPKFADRFNLRVYGRTRKPVLRPTIQASETTTQQQQQQQEKPAVVEVTATPIQQEQQELEKPIVAQQEAAPIVAAAASEPQEQILITNAQPQFEQCIIPNCYNIIFCR